VMLACSKGKLAWVIRSLTLIIPCRKPLSFTISAWNTSSLKAPIRLGSELKLATPAEKTARDCCVAALCWANPLLVPGGAWVGAALGQTQVQSWRRARW
jgi:hypothetical protein